MTTASNSDLMNQLRAVECRDSTYWEASPPLVFDRAEGSIIWDVEGRDYIDLCAGFGVMALGHGSRAHRTVFAKYAAQSGPLPVIHGMGDVYPSRAKVALLSRLAALLPGGLKRGALALSGGQAVELAVKTALQHTGRSGIIAFEGGYHGLDLGILSLTSREDFRLPFDRWLPQGKVVRLPYGCDRKWLHEACKSLSEAGHGVAAIITEPIQGRAGMVSPPAGWLQILREEADAAGALLIYDEIFTGLGRTGLMTHAELVPCDLLCLGKALGGGLPLSACFGTEEAMSGWPENQGEAIHTGTFFGHPLACDLGLAVLDTIEADDLCARSRELGERMKSYIKREIGTRSSVKDVRGAGMFIGIEFASRGLGAEYMNRLRTKGVIALASGPHGEGLSMTPALTIDESLWQEAVGRLASLLP